MVLDVSEKADGIFFGTLSSGKGQLWISNIRFEVVGSDVPVTGITPAPEETKPRNLELSR